MLSGLRSTAATTEKQGSSDAVRRASEAPPQPGPPLTARDEAAPEDQLLDKSHLTAGSGGSQPLPRTNRNQIDGGRERSSSTTIEENEQSD